MRENKSSATINLEGNPSVNRDLLKKAADIADQLEKIGVDTDAGYNIAPALGGTVVARPPRPRTTAQSAFVRQASQAGL